MVAWDVRVRRASVAPGQWVRESSIPDGDRSAFIDLIDRPAIFDLILDLMGPYIQFSMSQAIVRASTDLFPGYTHTDGGQAQKAIRVSETSRPLAVMVMYLLTDVTADNSGNFTVFPGSHLRPFPERAERIPHPGMPGAVPLLGKAGDAYHIVDGSTICVDKGYHPCAVLPGYEMYYFTILGGLTQRPLVQYFQPSHAAQLETIPGIKDMIAKFK